MDKRLYIIGGCNGAGKTMASYTVLPDILQCREFVNADEIAHGGKAVPTTILNQELFDKMKEYVR